MQLRAVWLAIKQHWYSCPPTQCAIETGAVNTQFCKSGTSFVCRINHKANKAKCLNASQNANYFSIAYCFIFHHLLNYHDNSDKGIKKNNKVV